MKKKRIYGVCMTLLSILIISLAGAYTSYAATDFISKGRLEYTNQTPDDPSDDVIFDSKDLTVLDTAISTLDTRITTLSGIVDTGIGRIVDELNRYPGMDLEQKAPDGSGSNPSLEEIAQAISGLTNIPADTYFYESRTEGNANIVRYKKIDGNYYICDAHGAVNEGAGPVDVSQKTLVDYKKAVSANLSAGAAAFSDGHLHLGDGSDNASHYQQGIAFADSRVNTNSASYTDGYEAGKKDSTIVEIPPFKDAGESWSTTGHSEFNSNPTKTFTASEDCNVLCVFSVAGPTGGTYSFNSTGTVLYEENFTGGNSTSGMATAMRMYYLESGQSITLSASVRPELWNYYTLSYTVYK